MNNEIFQMGRSYKTIQSLLVYKLDIEKTRSTFDTHVTTKNQESKPDVDLTTLHFLCRDKGITEVYFIPEYAVSSSSIIADSADGGVALLHSRVLIGNEVHRMNFNSKMLDFLLENRCITEVSEVDKQAKVLLQGL